ncbi:Cullin repeat-like-containing domain protein [Lactifluus subvellereus]|nr:Cullin repeat-like-containing domain protein [Lactifluus subvellereus]
MCSPQERVYVRSANPLGVLDLGHDLFARHLITHPAIKDLVISSVLRLMRVECDGYAIDRSVVRKCVDVLVQLNDHPDGTSIYARYLEPQILRESDMYYKAEAIRLRGTCDPLEYERRVDARLSDEEIRAREYLSTQTSAPLQDIIQNAFRPSYPSFMQLFASM